MEHWELASTKFNIEKKTFEAPYIVNSYTATPLYVSFTIEYPQIHCYVILFSHETAMNSGYTLCSDTPRA